ncbi:biopolymer transporter ExbD [Flavobacterium sp.]|uniref:ExbD/TolR family protein n=1 Tax=Flavobacterium sp. TaxID=239 RepID=UPI0026041E0D|nr:biopolymer transporter ExbD [Flavobacterium sp.]
MAKIKMSKNAASIDMTAMCDVAFLLLTFFILTATAKTPEALPVTTPASTVEVKLPDTGLVTLTIGKSEGKDKVFFGMKDRDIRVKTLELMAAKYKLSFTPEESAQFSLIEEFGVPIEALKQIIAMKSADRNKEGLQPGIPLDSLNNQLKDWIYTARQANIELGKDKDLDFAIKGDAKQEYPKIKKVMDILQDQKINSFNLVTGSRGKDF